MLDHADEAMENGAAGFSTGLFYPTNAAADIDEVAARRGALSRRMAASTPRICATRGERVLDSIDETLTPPAAPTSRSSSRTTNAPDRKTGAARARRCRRSRRRRKRQPVALDAYPYAAGSTNLRADLVTDEYRIMITWSRPHPETTGRDLADIAAEWGVDLAGSGAAARSGRRNLFPDGRGGRPRACWASR